MSSDHLLLRGSSLRNTDWVIGFVVYAGHQTKIMMNSTGARFKMSKIDRLTNKQIIIVFCVQTICCLISAIFGTIYTLVIKDYTYLGFAGVQSAWETDWPLMIIKNTGTWILLFT